MFNQGIDLAKQSSVFKCEAYYETAKKVNFTKMYLLFGNFEGVELVEETETRGNDATSRNPPHSTTHAFSMLLCLQPLS